MAETVTVDGKELAAALKVVALPTNRTVLPILHNVLLREGKVINYDLRTMVSVDIPSMRKDAPVVMLPLKALKQLLVGVKGEVAFEVNGAAAVEVVLPHGKALLTPQGGHTPEDYPEGPSLDDSTPCYSIPAAAFLDAMRKVEWAVAREETRPGLTAVRMLAKDGQLELTSTDTYRLAHITVPAPEFPDGWTILLRLSTIIPLLRMLPGSESISVAAGENVMVFVIPGKGEIASSIVEGHFPDPQEILQQREESTFSLIFNRTALNDHLAHVNKVLGKVYKPRSIWRRENDGYAISAEDSGQSISQMVACETTGTPPGSFGLNPFYAADYTRTADAETIQIEGSSSSRPVFWSGDASDAVCVQMPMILREEEQKS